MQELIDSFSETPATFTGDCPSHAVVIAAARKGLTSQSKKHINEEASHMTATTRTNSNSNNNPREEQEEEEKKKRREGKM